MHVLSPRAFVEPPTYILTIGHQLGKHPKTPVYWRSRLGSRSSRSPRHKIRRRQECAWRVTDGELKQKIKKDRKNTRCVYVARAHAKGQNMCHSAGLVRIEKLARSVEYVTSWMSGIRPSRTISRKSLASLAMAERMCDTHQTVKNIHKYSHRAHMWLVNMFEINRFLMMVRLSGDKWIDIGDCVSTGSSRWSCRCRVNIINM